MSTIVIEQATRYFTVLVFQQIRHLAEEVRFSMSIQLSPVCRKRVSYTGLQQSFGPYYTLHGLSPTRKHVSDLSATCLFYVHL